MLPRAITNSEYLPPAMVDELTTPGLVQTTQSGTAVRRVQEWLTIHGFGVDIDEAFGPATEQQVKAFQQSRTLPASGAVDGSTWDALVDPMVRAIAPIAPGGMSFSDHVAACARQHVGQHPVEAGGDNRGPWVRAYLGWDGKAARWCAGFASFAFRQAAHDRGGAAPIKGSESCVSLGEEASSAGLLKSGAGTAHSPAAIPAGSLFLVGAPGGYHHVGVVQAADTDTFSTLEGNTDHDGSDNGYEAAARVRGYDGKDFVVW